MTTSSSFLKKIFTSLFCICLAAALPSDLYISSLPAISSVMKITTYFSQLTMTIFLLGFALAQFAYGPLSDHYGRKKIILAGLLIAVSGSIVCCFVKTITMLLIGRFLQGLGASSCLAIPRAVLRDIFHGNAMSKNIAYLSAFVESVTALSPFIGGYVVQHFGWRYNFYILLLINLITIIMVATYLPETNPNIRNSKLRLSIIIDSYIKNIINLRLLFFAFCGCVAYTNLMLYFTVSPFILQNQLNLSAQNYGFFTLFVSFSLVIGAILNNRLIGNLGIYKMILLSSALIIMSGLFLSICAFFSYMNVLVIIVPCMISVIGSAFLFYNGISGALLHIQKDIGVVSALYGGLQILGSFFIINFVIQLGSLPDILKLSFTFIISSVILWLSMGFRKIKKYYRNRIYC